MSDRPQSTQETPAERLAATWYRYYVQECAGLGVLIEPHEFRDLTEEGRLVQVRACERILADKQRVDDAWFAWTQAGQMPGEGPVDPEAPPMPTEVWP